MDEKKKEKKWKKQFLKQKIGLKYHNLNPDQSVNLSRITMLLFDFQNKFPEEVSNLVDLGGYLDQGQVIDTSSIENIQSKTILENIFTVLNLQENDHKFSKTDQKFSIKEIFQQIFDR